MAKSAIKSSPQSKRGSKTSTNYPREEVLQLFNAGQLSVEAAMRQLSLSRSSLYRLSRAYQDHGVAALVHGNKGRSPNNKMQPAMHDRIKELLQVKYDGFQASLAAQYLRQEEGIEVSKETVRRIMREIEPSQKTSKGGVAHRLRRRRSAFGELIQIDGSPHEWFGPNAEKSCLIAFIDDATSMITDAAFFETERTEGYLQLIEHHLIKYGIPVAFYSDRHSIFDSVVKDVFGHSEPTQYQRVCSTFGIEAIRAYSPQAKGRIERLFRTLQGRWPKEFVLRGISTIEQANDSIKELIESYNEQFSLQRPGLADAHVQMSDIESIKRICALWHPRHLSKDLTCRFKGSRIQVFGQSRVILSGQEIQVLEYRDGKLEVLWERIDRGKKVSVLLPFAQSEVSQITEFKQYENSKTVDAHLDKIRRSEQSRRANWINRRREAAERYLDEQEKEVEKLEDKVERNKRSTEH